ncbi:MAG: ATP-grasp domain-containing protein [Thermoleophilaceae bacterium]
MRLVEDSSKALLARYGLPAPAGRLCFSADECRSAAAELGCPVYVKAQIPFGDRAALGLVAKVVTPDEAAQQVDDLIGRAVEGMTVTSVLVETAVEPELIVYLSAHVDDAAGARILRVGLGGGAGYSPKEAEVQVPIPLGGLETFELRKLLSATGLRGAQRESVTRAAGAVARASREWHAYTIEVNPLFVTADGAVAIDAKAELDDYSLASMPDRSLLPEQTESQREREARRFQEGDHRGSFRFVQLVDEAEAVGAGRLVGSHSVGGGESLVVFDALQAVGLRPANYCDTSGAPSREKVAFAAQLIASQPHIAGFFFSSCIANQPLSVTAAGLIDGFDAARWRGPTVVRIAGNEEEQARAIVEAWAEQTGVPATVVGREVDEWEAAELLAAALVGGAAA